MCDTSLLGQANILWSDLKREGLLRFIDLCGMFYAGDWPDSIQVGQEIYSVLLENEFFSRMLLKKRVANICINNAGGEDGRTNLARRIAIKLKRVLAV